MKKNILLPLAMMAGLSTTAMSDPFYNSVPAAYQDVPQSVSGPYIGIAYGMTNVDSDFFVSPTYLENVDIDYDALMLQVGYDFNPYIAAEFRYWFSLSDGDYSLASGFVIPDSYKDFNAWGIYLKPQYPVTEQFSIYMLLGFSGIHVDGEPGWYDDLVDDVSFSGGFGAAVNFTENISAFVDYVQLYNDRYGYYDPYYVSYYDPQGTDIYTINFGLTYKF